MIESSQLSAVDESILDELEVGARTKGFLVDKTGFHRNTIGQHLKVLEAGDAVKCIHDSTALYRLKRDPRKVQQ